MLVASGASFDKILTYRVKNRLHDQLVRLWNYLDEVDFPDLFAITARWAINLFDKVSSKILLSSLLYGSVLVGITAIGTAGPYRTWKPIEAPDMIVYGFALASDIAILLCTAFVFRRMQFSSGLKNLGLLLFLIELNIVVSVLLFSGLQRFSEVARDHSWFGMTAYKMNMEKQEIEVLNAMIKDPLIKAKLMQNADNRNFFPLSTDAVAYVRSCRPYFFDLKQTPFCLWELIRNGRTYWEMWLEVEIHDKGYSLTYERMFYALASRRTLFLTGAVAIPLLLFFLTLSILVVTKLVVTFCHKASMYFLDLATEASVKEFAPFTLAGFVCAAVLAIAKLVVGLFT